MTNLVDEKRLEELKKIYPFTIGGPAIVDLIESYSLALKVVRAGNNIEDILEVPPLLGDHSSMVCQKAIDDFRDALRPFSQGEKEK